MKLMLPEAAGLIAVQNEPKVSVDHAQPLNVIVRRYMDLAKYIDLLRTKELYLRRADRFTDRFEGALTPVIRRTLNDAHVNGGMKEDADEYYRRTRMGHFVSCWNRSAKDSMALWQLYGGAGSSVAITTTVQNLVLAGLGWKEEDEVLIRNVKYIDHFKNPDMIVGRASDLLEFKHEAYKYEGEIRIIVPRQEVYKDNPVALRLPLGNLNDFIRSVVVAPEADPWFFELVKDVTAKYGVVSPVRRSMLTFLPK
jgi:hypothetical protein